VGYKFPLMSVNNQLLKSLPKIINNVVTIIVRELLSSHQSTHTHTHRWALRAEETFRKSLRSSNVDR